MDQPIITHILQLLQNLEIGKIFCKPNSLAKYLYHISQFHLNGNNDVE